MGSSTIYELAMLLSLRDAASGKLDAFKDKLRATGKEGRKALQDIDALEKGMGRNFAIAGVGLAGLMVIKDGVKYAGDFQASMTELRTTFTQLNRDGSTNLKELGANMGRAEQLAMRLGNALPGTTEDFVRMMAVLKQNGLEIETILGGAGEAVANLAVSNNQAPAVIAKDIARFGQLYQLRANEYIKAADLFSRIYTSKGIESGELIEGAKFFQGRAGASLKLTGLQGAEQATRFLAFMREKGGLEGSEAGTSSSTFLKQLVVNKKALAEIRKEHGITLDLFDKKGEFKGFDNAFQQLEKLRKLNPEQQLAAVNKLGGEEGARAGTAMIQGGLDGWRKFNEQLNQTISQQDKVAQKSQDFNNKVEALQGSLTNLKVTAFDPLIPPLTQLADKANTAVGAVQDFARTHPTLTTTTVFVFSLGSAALFAYGTIGGLIKMYKILSFMSTLSNLAEGGKNVSLFSRAWGKLSAMPNKLTFSLSVAAVAFTLAEIVEMIKTIEEYEKAHAGEIEAEKRNRGALSKLEANSKSAGVPIDPKIYHSDASAIFKALNPKEQSSGFWLPGIGEVKTFERTKGELEAALNPDLSTLTLNPYKGVFGYSSGAAQQVIRERGTGLSDVNIMREFIGTVKRNLAPEDATRFLKDVQAVHPQAFTEAMRQIGESAQGIQQPLQQTAEGMTNLQTSMQPLPKTVDSVRDSFGLLNSRLNSFDPAAIIQGKLNSMRFSVDKDGKVIASGNSTSGNNETPKADGSAIGSIVTKDGLVSAHRGNVIFPANLSRRSPGDWLSDFGALKAIANKAMQGGSKTLPKGINVDIFSPITSILDVKENKSYTNMRANRFNVRENLTAINAPRISQRVSVASARSRQPEGNHYHIQTGNITVNASSDSEALRKLKEQQERQYAEVKKQLDDNRRLERRVKRAYEIGAERA